ncbi:translocation/assembly module TamB domain-containing protein [Rhizobium halophytocola]|uniref:Translocation and assembly module TamB n=1 Tax=Rhizobium halophytocola TaxID=735519 RepID=A0ABS4E2T2_9HYPH|nr:translocation/assembly module TamB domain-containing protein [Rhizobium halophytocola]MBP1852214.1 translocation and assembly module TamB [Rhizobium halophytocola]
MPANSRPILWIGRLVAWTLGLCVGIGLLLIVLLGFSSAGSGLLADVAGRLASGPGRTVTIDHIGPLLTGKLRIGSVVVADERGAYAELHDLAIDWTPSDLLKGTFKAERIAVASVKLDRLPQPPADQPVTDSTDSGTFSLPVKLDIAKISLPSISLGTAVAGRPFELAADGALNADDQEITARLGADRTDTSDTHLNLNLSYVPVDNRLVLDGSYAEPKAGLVGTLLRLPGQPAMTVELNGQGPLSDWAGSLNADLDGKRVASLDATHRVDDAGTRQVTLSGGGTFAALLPPWLRETFSGETTVDLSASLKGENQVLIDTARLSTGDMILTASGQYDPQGDNDISADLVGVGGPLALRWPLQEGELALAIRRIGLTAKGPSSKVALHINGQIASLDTPPASVEGMTFSVSSNSFDLGSRTGAANAVISVTKTTFQQPDLERALKAPLTLRAPLTIETGAISTEGATLESQKLGGTVSGRFDLATNAITAVIALKADPSALPPPASSKLKAPVEVSGKVDYVNPDDISATDLKIRSDLASIDGSARLADGSLDADLTGEIANIGALLENAEGKANVTAKVSGPLDALQADAQVTIPSATLAGRKLADLSITAKGGLSDGAPEGTVTANGSLDGQDIAVNADLVSEDGQTKIPQLEMTVGKNRITGALAFTPQYLPSGDIKLDLPQLDLLAALAGQKVTGDLAGTIHLDSSGSKMAAKVDLSGSKIQRDTLTIANPKVGVTVDDLKALSAEGAISADKVTSGSNVVSNPKVDFARDGKATTFDATANYDNAPVKATGKVVESGSAIDVVIDQLKASPKGIPLELAAPSTVKIVNGSASVDDLRIKAGSGTITLNGDAGSKLDMDARIDKLPAGLANTVVPNLGAGGSISGTVSANGTASNPSVDYKMSWSGAAIAQAQAAGLPPLTVEASGRFADSKLTVNTSLSGVAGLSASGGGSVTISGDKALSYKLSGQIPLSLFAGQLAANGLILEGAADIDASVSGSASAPAINGRAVVTKGRLTDVRHNVTIEDLTTTLSIEGDQARITGLKGRLSGGGLVSGEGTINLKGPGLPSDIELNLDKAQYSDGEMFTTSATGMLALNGPLTAGPKLSGKITLGETSVTVPESLPRSLRDLDITHRNAPADVRRQTAAIQKKESNGTSSDIGLDLAVSAPNRIFVRGRGIDAELGGALKISGGVSNPVVSGAFTLNRGRLSILTKRLTFTKGTITFGGNLIPLLNFEATTTSGGTAITITISGLANDPQVSFSSSPALPQDEILAQLIFGQSMSKLSPLQIAQLADAVSQLAGGRSSSLLENLRSGLGIDNLDVTTDAEGNAAVSAGKYLNDRTYLELQSGEDGGKAVINLDIGKGLKLKGEAGGNGSSGGGIFYEKEY